MITLRRGTPGEVEDGRIRGLWFPLLIGNARYTATLNCPGCGKRGTLEDHEIKADGTLHPSIECPHGCGFHDTGRLLDWPAEWSTPPGDFAPHDARLLDALQRTVDASQAA